MNKPVDIKIAHINKVDNIHNSINKELVFEIFGQLAPDALAPFYKFQQTWVNKTYSVFNFGSVFILMIFFCMTNNSSPIATSVSFY